MHVLLTESNHDRTMGAICITFNIIGHEHIDDWIRCLMKMMVYHVGKYLFVVSESHVWGQV